ncbi:2TM domain-containing protein [Flavobacterium aestuarii]|uniref:2TM domain-containing protein n=1 Tax=Flavobacterium aestuarii TaxID=3149227 RepID=UPI0032B44C44
MDHFTKNMFGFGEDKKYNEDENYNIAYKRVQAIKGFYTHLFVYVLVNIVLTLFSLNWPAFGTADFYEFWIFYRPFFWGIGLLFHWFSVFGRNLIFSKHWEQQKIKQFLEKENKNKWQ